MNRLHDINIASSMENSMETLRFIIEQGPRNDIANLRQFITLYQQVLARVESEAEVAELDELLVRLQER